MIGGHGWVTPREDGAKARCGGPSICAKCAVEKAANDATQNMQTQADSAKCVESIINDLYDRNGFDHWWDSVDPETRAEIMSSLVKKIVYVIEDR